MVVSTPGAAAPGAAAENRVWRLMGRVLAWPAAALTWLSESALSRRAIALGLILAFAYLAISPWLRPPIRRDLRAPRLPYAVFSGQAFQPSEIEAPRVNRLDSVAAPIVLVCAAGLVAVLIDPKYLAPVSGSVAALAIAGTAATMLNHPKLIESLGLEYVQRLNVQRVLAAEREYNVASLVSTRIDDGHIAKGLFPVRPDPHDPMHARYFLIWSPWLVLVSLAAAGAAAGGGVAQRAAVVGVWAVVGAGLATAATHRRITAERLWAQAERAEFANRLDAAHATLDRLVRGFPDFADTRRMLLARGRLDYRAGRDTPHAGLFQATQMRAVDGSRAEFDRVLTALPGSEAARDLAASADFSEAARAYAAGRAGAAQGLWRDGAAIAPWRLDCRVAHAAVTEEIEAAEPGRVADLLLPYVDRIGDRMLRADLLAIIGDSYLEASELREGRRYFAESIDVFSLPKLINPYAQEAMLGM